LEAERSLVSAQDTVFAREGPVFMGLAVLRLGIEVLSHDFYQGKLIGISGYFVLVYLSCRLYLGDIDFIGDHLSFIVLVPGVSSGLGLDVVASS
jgi:hypothetical protein